jgi:Zn ribbon nucleic-acid-binding protein
VIAVQRALVESNNPFERLVGALLIAGMLEQRLRHLNDRQVGQLLLDYCGNDVGMLLPETVIHRHATRRLFRSVGGSVTAEELKEQRPGATCPRCGSEMLQHIGIDEPDFSQCVLVKCGYKEHTRGGPYWDSSKGKT